MKDPNISIIIPVYNTERYLHDCINSVIAQTYTQWELLLIDDGSTDNSGRICDEYAHKDTRIRVYHQSNLGVSAARNRGLREIRGKWVTFIDSDDYVTPSYLSSFDFEHDLCLQGYMIGTMKISYQECVFHGYVGAEWIHHHYMLGPVCKLFNVNIIKNNDLNFDQGLSLGEDFLFNCQYLYYCHSMHVLPVVSYTYRRHGNKTLSREKKKYEEIYRMYLLHTEWIVILIKGSPYKKEIQRHEIGMFAHLVDCYGIRYEQISNDHFLNDHFQNLPFSIKAIIKFAPSYIKYYYKFYVRYVIS